MPATVRKLSVSDSSDSLVDINEASAQELRDALPGIGDILARRIVLYRNEHGPFEHPDDLMRVPGLNGKRISKLASRVSVVPPNSGFRVPAANSAANESVEWTSDDYVHPMPIFSIVSDPLPMQAPPSMTSLMPDGPRETMGTSVLPSAPPGTYVVGGSLLSGAPPSNAASPRPTFSPTPETSHFADDDVFTLPLQRPARVAVAIVMLGVFSALVGSIFGIRSQEGGPRNRVEQRVGKVEWNVADLTGSVKALEGKASAFASSINALDQRVTEQSHPVARSPQAQVETRSPVSSEPESRTSAVRRRVRQAMRELEPVAPTPRDP